VVPVGGGIHQQGTAALYAVLRKAKALGPAYTPEVRVCTRRRGEQVELPVHDNGVGISSLDVGKVFDPFFTTKPPGEGTGLGLWLGYDIVTKGHGGTLAVDSQAGEYTEFVVTLPAESSSPAARVHAHKKVAQNERPAPLTEATNAAPTTK